MLLTGKNKERVSETELDRLTLTALKVKSGFSQRLTVPHDFKKRFPRTSTNEFTECRKTATALYESYLKLRKKRKRKVSRPTTVNRFRRIPRWIFSQRFSFIEKRTPHARYWLDVRDALDSVPAGRKWHDRLLLPLKVSPFHLNQLERGEIKALQIFTDFSTKWWATLAVRAEIPEVANENLPIAVLGIDLGIKKAACTTLVRPDKVSETRYFRQQEKIKRINQLDTKVSILQKEIDSRRNSEQGYDKVLLKLRKLKHKRQNVAREYDRVLVSQLLSYVSYLSERYTLYVSLGKLRGIRNSARRGNGKGSAFRGMIHRWAFGRITNSLMYGLSQIGWKVDGKGSRFKAVPESWTSIVCWKCGRKGIRPRQNLFICPTCGNKCNADRNGAINIAARLIMLTDSLHSVRGLGKWADATSRAKCSRPKTLGIRSQGMSLLSKVDLSSESGKPAAVRRAQASLLIFSDDVEMGDDDHAVERTVENFSAIRSDDLMITQKKDARSKGGNSSR